MDTEIKRMVLKELMNQLDGMDRDGLKDQVLDHSEPMDQPPTDLEKDGDKEVHGIIMADEKEPDEDDMPSIDPLVMLAKRFHK